MPKCMLLSTVCFQTPRRVLITLPFVQVLIIPDEFGFNYNKTKQ